MSYVLITLKPGQPMKIETKGIPGGNCHQASKPYLDALGGHVISDTPTAEANLPEVKAQQKVNLGDR